MTYPRNLGEFSEQELLQELDDRFALRQRGECDYCARNVGTEPCRFSERHKLHPVIPGWVNEPSIIAEASLPVVFSKLLLIARAAEALRISAFVRKLGGVVVGNESWKILVSLLDTPPE